MTAPRPEGDRRQIGELRDAAWERERAEWWKDKAHGLMAYIERLHNRIDALSAPTEGAEGP